MIQIVLIAKNTFLEIIRDRILYGLILFAVLLIGLSLLLGQLSFTEQSRISANFGFTAIHLSLIVISIFVGSSLVAKELEKKTVFTLLVRPLSRLQFVLGKILGLIYVLLVVIGGLGIIQMGVFLGLGVPLTAQFFVGLYGVLLESVVLLCVTVMFSCMSRPVLAVTFSIGIFLVGHWVESLEFFSQRASSESFRGFGSLVASVFPNFEKFNWRSLVIYDDPVPGLELLYSSCYAFAWAIFFIALANILLRNKDFA